MGSSENFNKNEHGKKAKKALEELIINLKDEDYIVDYQINYRVRDPRYAEEQFFFQSRVKFRDSDEWILHSTTSIRDRITEQQWNSENIKRINSYVKKAYVVVPDNLEEKDKKAADGYNDKIVHEKIYSALDGVVPLSKVASLIENKGIEQMERGHARAKLGLSYEKRVTEAMNCVENWNVWKKNGGFATGYHYDIFKKIVDKLGLYPDRVSSFYATTQIPSLPGGGRPKTDVLLHIRMIDGEEETATFSCKRSSAEWVSVHEYKSDDFAEVLDSENALLELYLLLFQQKGGIKEMGEGAAEGLEREMKKYSDKLARWVFGGINGDGDPDTQWASHIITYSDITFEAKVFTIDEYIKECKRSGVMGQFGTLFKWTYPSKGKGKRIQLKGKVL